MSLHLSAKCKCVITRDVTPVSSLSGGPLACPVSSSATCSSAEATPTDDLMTQMVFQRLHASFQKPTNMWRARLRHEPPPRCMRVSATGGTIFANGTHEIGSRCLGDTQCPELHIAQRFSARRLALE